MQTETFILHQLQGKGWMSHPTNAAHQLDRASIAIVEHSGNSLTKVWKSVFLKEGARGLFKVCGTQRAFSLTSFSFEFGARFCAGYHLELD
jgi:hypothetical protein